MSKLEKIIEIINIIQDENVKNIEDVIPLIQERGLFDFLNEHRELIFYLLLE